MTVQELVNAKLAPRLQGDGGWVEIEAASDGALTLVFRGECSKCLILDRCVSWIEEQLKNEFGREYKVTPIRKKPFFWDT